MAYSHLIEFTLRLSGRYFNSVQLLNYYYSVYCVQLVHFVFASDVAIDFEIVSTEECTPSELSGTGRQRQEMYKKLESDLVSQIKMCQANRVYFKSTGDVASTNKFHQMEEHTKKDLDSLR